MRACLRPQNQIRGAGRPLTLEFSNSEGGKMEFTFTQPGSIGIAFEHQKKARPSPLVLEYP